MTSRGRCCFIPALSKSQLLFISPQVRLLQLSQFLVWVRVTSCPLTFVALDLTDGRVLPRSHGLLQPHLSKRNTTSHPAWLLSVHHQGASLQASLTTLTRPAGLLSISGSCSSNERLQKQKGSVRVQEVGGSSHGTTDRRNRLNRTKLPLQQQQQQQR